MSRSVPDTNIWISGIRWRGRPSEIVRLGQEGDITLITSLSILAELTHVLRDYFGASDDEAYEVYKRIGTFAEIVYPTQWVNAVPEDPDDNKFVECALEGRAQYIISRDQDLLRLGEYEGIRMVDDVEFLDILRTEGTVQYPGQGG